MHTDTFIPNELKRKAVLLSPQELQAKHNKIITEGKPELIEGGGPESGPELDYFGHHLDNQTAFRDDEEFAVYELTDNEEILYVSNAEHADEFLQGIPF